MIKVMTGSWALFLGIGLLMVGNGMQGTLLGIRGGIEGFSTAEMSIVMSAYFVGFLGGSRLAPEMIRRVGHVRVFAALGSFISAVLILYPSLTDPWAWAVLRILIGFCFSGVYVTAESWLNNSTTNDTRGQALSLYMIVQMLGIIVAQALLLTGDPSGFALFVIPSVLVSLSFAPILLAVTPAPTFGSVKPMSLRRLYRSSPLGCIGMVLTGGMYAAQFGMASVYGTLIGLSVAQIALFVGMIYLGGLLFQYPIGWLSDRVDRRMLILAAAGIAMVACALGAAVASPSLGLLLGMAFVLGGMTNPIYALLIAHTNDYLDRDDMAAASGGLIFINGIGAIAGPLAIGVLMEVLGPPGFWVFVAVLMGALAAYTGWRMTRRAPAEETGAYVAVTPASTAVAAGSARGLIAPERPGA